MKQQNIPIESVKLGLKKGPGGDYFEHDLARLAGTLSSERQKQFPGCRVWFDYDLARLQSADGVRHPVIVIENQDGYQPTTFDIGSTDETASWNVNQANAALNLMASEVDAIINSSMQDE